MLEESSAFRGTAAPCTIGYSTTRLISGTCQIGSVGFHHLDRTCCRVGGGTTVSVDLRVCAAYLSAFGIRDSPGIFATTQSATAHKVRMHAADGAPTRAGATAFFDSAGNVS